MSCKRLLLASGWGLLFGVVSISGAWAAKLVDSERMAEQLRSVWKTSCEVVERYYFPVLLGAAGSEVTPKKLVKLLIEAEEAVQESDRYAQFNFRAQISLNLLLSAKAPKMIRAILPDDLASSKQVYDLYIQWVPEKAPVKLPVQAEESVDHGAESESEDNPATGFVVDDWDACVVQ